MKKRILSILLTLVMALSVSPIGAFTASAATTDDGLKYSIYGGEVKITGCNGFPTELEIPAQIEGYPVTSIGYEAFYYRSSLTSVTIPDSVTSIGYEAFQYCSSLTTITIPDSVTSIGYDAFSGTAYYNTPNNWKDKVLYLNNHLIEAKDSIETCNAKEGTKTIADYAFEYCSSLTTITIPDSVTSIGSSAFYGCSSLKTIFYGGSEAEKARMEISSGNDALWFDAIWHYEATDHSWDSGKITTQPSCAEGVKTFYCTLDGCDGTKNETLKALGHTEVTIPAKVPTYAATGLTAGKKCSVCGKITVAQQTIAKLTKTSLKKAKLTVKAQTYTGKALKPSVTVKLGNKTLKKNVDYTISYKNNKKVGKATVTIKGIGAYEGSVSKTFAINPKKLSGLKVKAGKKQMTVSWKKDKAVGGYEILYATSKNFKKGKKTVKVTKASTAKKVIKKLKSKKTYYIKVRSFKKVSGKTYYGAYTSVKKVKVK